MARAFPLQDASESLGDARPGEWQALRGELVALLDQVEGRYARTAEPEPAVDGLTQRVRNLRDQVQAPEPAARHQEALRSVKRAVDRFNERDDSSVAGQQDALTSAIAEIRSRRLAAPDRRVSEMPELRDLNSLVGSLSNRLERLEGELKSQRNTTGVREVASQVEQLAQVVELLAGAVGETGQVKRLEAQIAALAALVEDGAKTDLSTINWRLDDVSATVAKLAELQAEQMEREIMRQDARVAQPELDSAGILAPAMQSIEHSVRNVYDRIDAIEKNVSLSSGELDRLTTEMAAFTQAMTDGAAAPAKLFEKIDGLAARIGAFEDAHSDVAGLKSDISAVRDAVLGAMEPRFASIETRLDTLSERVATPADTTEIESQLKLLMLRMDETGAQLTRLADLYAKPAELPDFEALASHAAERASQAMAQKTPAPIAMFGPDSLKSIENRIENLLKTAGQPADYETIASMVAAKTAAAVVEARPQGAVADDMSALEQRVTSLLDSTGQETSKRLTRLEAAITARSVATSDDTVAPAAVSGAVRSERLDAMLAALGIIDADRDAMPVNPVVDAPLLDLGAKASPAADVKETPAVAGSRPVFDPAAIERPARPKSSFASDLDALTPVAEGAAPAVEVSASQNGTSSFVAAARRAQRQTEVPSIAENATSASAIGRAFSLFKPAKPADVEPELSQLPSEARRDKSAIRSDALHQAAEPLADADSLETADDVSFFVKHRRPLLLAMAVVGVSVLALTLVLQHSIVLTPSAPSAIARSIETPLPSAQPTEDESVSLVRPEVRAADMIDDGVTGSIPASSFAKPAVAMAASVPGRMVGEESERVVQQSAAAAPALPELPVDTAPAVVETFDLPPEGVGPIALRQAAADGDARAQFEIAAIYTEGRAVEQDYLEAAKWYERSAAQGLVPAQYRLGNLYEIGTGVEKDIAVARLWYQRAAEAGNRMAMHNLAALYASGQLGEPEFDTAAQWFEQAANLGMTDSQFNLGMLYARGLGVAQDSGQSYKWFALAARAGDVDAAKSRDDVAKSLSAEAIASLEAEVAAWQPQPIELASNFAPLGTWSPSFDPGQPITTRDVVSKVQQAFVRLGFDVGTPDGLTGPKTVDAIKAFERGTGMTEVGAINPRLLAVLGSQPV